jgi:L,D-peptidoglycan transpeptidase YkuD (ErfK/YbiS/YcfS/YnhG family)
VTTTKPRPKVDRLAHVSGTQAIVVTASKYGATTAQFTAYQREASGWKVAYGPWSAWVGSKGIAPAGAKREGDGRTPTGTYGFDFMFGVQPDPGVKFPYRVVTGPNIVWVEDPNSPNYNRWVDSNHEDIGNQADSMYKPQYNYGAVINYNTAARTPGLGSGIFIHLSRNRPSAGCITLPEDQLLAVLRWLDPSSSPAIVIGVG